MQTFATLQQLALNVHVKHSDLERDGAMGRRIDPSWWTHGDISRFSQCSTTSVTKAVVCVIMCVVWCI